jgi:histone H3/H4
MSENSTTTDTEPRNLLTSADFHALHSRYGFSQSQKGAEDVMNAALREVTTKLTRAAILQAEHDGRSGLNASHAQKAIDMTKEIPRGFY